MDCPNCGRTMQRGVCPVHGQTKKSGHFPSVTVTNNTATSSTLGPQGPQGVAGSPGNQGAIGAQGSPGNQGEAGTAMSNLDGGFPDSTYGAVDPIDGGGV